MSGVKGPITKLGALEKSIRGMSKGLGIQVARKAAPAITADAQRPFNSGRTVYGNARPLGVDGDQLSLVKSGATRGALKATSDGTTKIRFVLALKYMRYLIGKYAVLPAGKGAKLPKAMVASLTKLTTAAIEGRLKGDS